MDHPFTKRPSPLANAPLMRNQRVRLADNSLAAVVVGLVLVAVVYTAKT
jgi:hypothetical protein